MEVRSTKKKSVLVIAHELGSNRAGHAALPNSTWSSDGDEPVLPQFASQLFDDRVLSKQSCARSRQIDRRSESFGILMIEVGERYRRDKAVSSTGNGNQISVAVLAVP